MWNLTKFRYCLNQLYFSFNIVQSNNYFSTIIKWWKGLGLSNFQKFQCCLIILTRKSVLYIVKYQFTGYLCLFFNFFECWNLCHYESPVPAEEIGNPECTTQTLGEKYPSYGTEGCIMMYQVCQTVKWICRIAYTFHDSWLFPSCLLEVRTFQHLLIAAALRNLNDKYTTSANTEVQQVDVKPKVIHHLWPHHIETPGPVRSLK